MSAAELTVYERGVVPCKVCKRPHDLRDDPDHEGYKTWRADDGHAYFRMSAEQVIRLVQAALGVDT